MKIGLNGTEFYFDVEGAGLVPAGERMRERPTLVALHGGPGLDHSVFKPALSPLADVAQVVYLDMRAQGRSGRPPLETCTVRQMADDVAAFCRALSIERPVVLGYSFGGLVAQMLALRHPRLVGRLILAATGAQLHERGASYAILEERYGAEVRALAERLDAGQATEADRQRWQERVVPETAYPNPETRALVAAARARILRNDDLPAYRKTQLHDRPDFRSRLSEIVAPTLVIVGDYDWATPPAWSHELAAGIPGAELAILPQAGHWLIYDQNEAFLAAVRRFLAATEQAGGAADS